MTACILFSGIYYDLEYLLRLKGLWYRFGYGSLPPYDLVLRLGLLRNQISEFWFCWLFPQEVASERAPFPSHAW